MSPPQAKPIVAAPTNVMGVELQIVGVVDPDEFPNGLTMMFFAPGKLEPVGGFALRPGAVLAAVPPGKAADHLRAQARAAQGASGPGLSH